MDKGFIMLSRKFFSNEIWEATRAYQMRRLRARQASQGSGRMVRNIEYRKGSELFPVL
ncbi:hypothetical protein [Phocaeicola coprocola]|jgi:hypothetical protein|uniref:hypothetical protein n=1 Tax=Phocaeicola coprocola TaxID=310298 RepID=UPI00242BD600|nr:hypothetical protein [Phocaeicola coprocola]